MTTSFNRRSFIAAGTLAVPAVALARIPTTNTSAASAMKLHDLMEQANDHMRSLRGSIRSLDNASAREDAAFLANQITILLAQSIEVADQAELPEEAKAKYADDEAQFYTDFRLKLAESVSASVALTRQILLGNQAEASNLYRSLNDEKKEGHRAFKVKD